MLVELKVNQLLNNPSISGFFMREQAYNTLDQAYRSYVYDPESQAEFYSAVEHTYDNVEDMEEDCYNMSVEEFIFNINLADEEDYE